MKFRRGVWAFAFAFCLAGAAKAADTKRMLSMCEEVARGMSVRGKDVTLPRSPGAYMCWGFIGAVQDVSRITDSSGARLLSACVPDETTATEILQAFIKHARRNRQPLNRPSAIPGHLASPTQLRPPQSERSPQAQH